MNNQPDPAPALSSPPTNEEIAEFIKRLCPAAVPAPPQSNAEKQRIAEDGRIETVIVAVHGIGNQYRFATIQSVAHRIANYFGPPVGIPLGNFHAANQAIRGLPFKGQPTLGLAEVYWAHIPREANKDKDTIEETKAWAETLVQRVRAMDLNRPGQAGAPRTSVDYEKTSTVVAEMIDFIGTLENLTFLADKAGLMKFDLRELLDDYLGDVQIVAEFEDHRGRIMETFRQTMDALNKAHPNLKHIHLVAHSEGTVVTFRALLEALSAQALGKSGYEWIAKVKSLMTIGSPIDKHVVMWPELWSSFTPAPGNWRMPAPIRWWNYYDKGDPVGFELDTARQWLIHHGWITAKPDVVKKDGNKVPADAADQKFFDFPDDHEVGFTRYPLPGKAHNDYWNDKQVFDHFLASGMQLESGSPPKVPTKPKPRSIKRSLVVSWVVPYLFVLLLLATGTYLLYNNVAELNRSEETSTQIMISALGLTGLLAGVTVISRMPRLIPFSWWYLIPVVVFSAGAALYSWLIHDTAADKLGWTFGAAKGNPSLWTLILVCLGVGVVSAVCSKLKPKWGMLPLMTTSGIVTAWVVWTILRNAEPIKGHEPKLWPVVLCVLAFLYLWWLAARFFDLVFIWHRYICSNLANNTLKKFDPLLASRKHVAK